jgi:ubiquinone/menaquinone biosynthesis C-methylase UbiE
VQQTEQETKWTRSRAYAKWFAKPLGQAYRRSVVEVVQPWLKSIRYGRVLDAGCGPILTFLEVFDQKAEVLAVDCSHEMAESAQAHMRDLGRRGQVLVASVAKLPVYDCLFDLVFSMNCLEFVQDREGALEELFRVATPGATAIFGVLNSRSLWELGRRLRRPFSSSPYYRGRFLHAAELERLVSRSGWRVEEVTKSVRFPPLSLPNLRFYKFFEHISLAALGGVILLRAARP